MPTKIALSTPISGPSTPDLEICHVELHRGINFVGTVRQVDKTTSYIRVRFAGQNGINIQFTYGGVNADDMIIAFDKANFSVKDMHTKIIERLIADAKPSDSQPTVILTGTISGAPD